MAKIIRCLGILYYHHKHVRYYNTSCASVNAFTLCRWYKIVDSKIVQFGHETYPFTKGGCTSTVYTLYIYILHRPIFSLSLNDCFVTNNYMQSNRSLKQIYMTKSVLKMKDFWKIIYVWTLFYVNSHLCFPI